MRLDVQNCVLELVDFGVARRISGDPARFTFARPSHPDALRLVDTFLERRAAISTEDQSPSVQRFREMIGRDEKMLVVFEWIRTAAKSDISVLILGPTGSGKELVARNDPRPVAAQRRSIPGRQLRGAARHAVRVRDLRLREGRVHRAPTIASPDASRWPTRAPSSSTRSATSRSSRRRSCCACSRNGDSSDSAATDRLPSTSG